MASSILNCISPAMLISRSSMLAAHRSNQPLTTCVFKPLPRPNRTVELIPTPLYTPPSPCLMLPPLFKGGDMVSRYYDLADDRVMPLHTRRDGVFSDDQFPPDEGVRFVGSSHGWVASYDDHTSHVYLSNPISGRHIKLPPLNTLQDDYLISMRDCGYISPEDVADPSKKVLPRVILSHSPEEEECRAMVCFGAGGRLAFCVVGVSTEWTPLGYNTFCENSTPFEVRPHCDFVYCSRRKVFTSITNTQFELTSFNFKLGKDELSFGCCQMLDWNCNILDPVSSEMIIIPTEDDDNREIFGVVSGPVHYVEGPCYWAHGSDVWEKDYLKMLKAECIQMVHIVRADQLSDHPLVVLRFVNRERGYSTVCFLVLEFNEVQFTYFNIVEDLKGLSIFVGMNHSFAIPASGVLKPNSIYYGDSGRIDDDDCNCNVDCGIYDYEKKKMVSTFDNLEGFTPPMFWFTPSPSNA